MPRRPSASTFTLTIDSDFDDSNNYRVKIFELEERESQFADSKGQMAIVWKMNIYRDDGTVFEDSRTGLPFDLWAWTSDSMFRTSKARGYVDAFMGHETTDNEVDEMIDNGFADALVGKTALGSFEVKQGVDGAERLTLVLLRPDRKARATARVRPAEPEPELDPEPEPVPVAVAGRRRSIDD